MKKILCFVIPLLLIIVFFPFLASTPLGKPFFIQLLKAKLSGDLTIEKVNLSWLGPQRFENIELTNADVNAKVGHFESNTPFWKLGHLGDSFDLQNGDFSFPAYGGGEIANVQAKIRGDHLNATGTTSQGGSFSVQGTIQSKQDLDITAILDQIPTIAIDKLLKLGGLLYKSLGSTLNANGALTFKQNEGTLALELSSLNAKANIDASIANGIISLKRPLLATLRVSEDLAKELTQHINPTVIKGFQPQNPFTLRIDPQNFSCSIQPFSFDNLQIGSAALDLGKVRVKSGKSLQSLLKLFKNKDFSKEIDIWFTSVAFQIQNGVINLGRVDALLSNSIHVCAWGSVDVKNDQLHMFLGLPADTLEQSFGIQALSRNYVLKIPVYGSISSPEFDTGSAIAKITTMAVSKQIPTKGGKILGGIVNAITQAQDDGDAPPPNRPFPWER